MTAADRCSGCDDDQCPNLCNYTSAAKAEVLRNERILRNNGPKPGSEQPPTCILTGADGENADDCTTHDHEGETRDQPARDGYLRVSLIVKAGTDTEDILRARSMVTSRLNVWFTELPFDVQAPYPVGTLLSYSIHDNENLSPIGRMSRGNPPVR